MDPDLEKAGFLFTVSVILFYIAYMYWDWRSGSPMGVRSYHITYDLMVLIVLGIAGSICGLLGGFFIQGFLQRKDTW